jgi:hypothetical protein
MDLLLEEIRTAYGEDGSPLWGTRVCNMKRLGK